MAQTQGERIVALETWQENHERRCEDRLSEIRNIASKTDANVEKLQGLVISLIIAVAGGAVAIVVGVILYASKLMG